MDIDEIAGRMYDDGRMPLTEEAVMVLSIRTTLTESAKSYDLRNSRDAIEFAESMSLFVGECLNEGISADIINEGFVDWIKRAGSGMVQNIKEGVIGFVMRMLGFKEDSFMYKYLKITLANVPVLQIPKLFTDCSFLLNKVTDGLAEFFIRDGLSSVMGDGFIASTAGQAIASALNDDGMIEKIQQTLAPKICSALQKGGASLAKQTGGTQQAAIAGA